MDKSDRDELVMTNQPYSPENARSFEDALIAIAKEFFFGFPQSNNAVRIVTSEISEEELRRSGSLLFRPFTLEGTYPQTHIIALFRDENHPKDLLGYKWPIRKPDDTDESVRDLAVYFHAHLCELIGAYDTGTLTRDTESFNGERLVWLTFDSSW